VLPSFGEEPSRLDRGLVQSAEINSRRMRKVTPPVPRFANPSIEDQAITFGRYLD
jgi:hypothetical protein